MLYRRQKLVVLMILLFVVDLFLPLDNHVIAKNSYSSKGTPGQLIIINKSTNQLGYFHNGELVQVFAVGTGRSNSLTPEGSFIIVNKIKNRPYYKKNIPGGHPRNPLGNRWLGLNARGTNGTTYAIHGNNNSASIGKYVSGGCVRMYNDEVRWLFEQVELYTPVIIGHYSANFEEAAKKVGYQLRGPIEVFMEGEQLKLENPPLLVNNHVLVPLRAIFSALGAKVTWEPKTQSITAEKGDRKIKLTVAGKQAFINDKEQMLEVPATVYNGATFVPVRFVTEALGANIRWDQETRVIAIAAKKEVETRIPVDISLNGQLNPFEQGAYLKNGITMVPLRDIIQEIGAIITRDQQNGQITVRKDETVVTLQVNESTAYVNDVETKLPIPVEVVGGTTYVPTRVISKAFNISIIWNKENNLVNINF